MACRLTEKVVDCRDPEATSAFWSAVLGYRELGREDGAIAIGPEEGFGGPAPAPVPSTHPDPTPGTVRWHVLAGTEGNVFCLPRPRV